jgi:serine phosphatase RsbU (regulator of sigma subunit)
VARRRPTRWETQPDWDTADESDIAAALVRTAFIISFTLTPFVVRITVERALPVQVMLVVASAFNLLLFGAYLRGHRLPLKRPLAILVDLALITSAIASFREIPYQRDWLVAMYYLIIMVAAIWHRRTGAVLTALVASVMYGMVGQSIPFGLGLLWGGHTPVLLLVAVTASYVVLARDRERAYSERLQHEMSLARHLQETMLPAELPTLPGLDIGYCFRPARVVGGDLYDAVRISDSQLLVGMGDMAGKSVYGLFHLSLLHSHLHAAAGEMTEPAEIAEAVNRNVYEAMQPDAYAALFVGVVNTAAQTLTFVNCGHLPPFVVRAGEGAEVVELTTGGIVIGAVREPAYKQRIERFGPGDLLVCYTDGVSEALNRDGEEYGAARIEAEAVKLRELGAAEIARGIMDASDRFSSDSGTDDRTVVVMRGTTGRERQAERQA